MGLLRATANALARLDSHLAAKPRSASRPANRVATPFGTRHGIGTDPAFMPLKSLHEMKPYERADAMRNSNFICNRLGLGRALIEGSTRYSLGDGLASYASSGDQAYDDDCNRLTDLLFESPNFDIAGEHDFYGLQHVACSAMMVKGDCGAGKILQRDALGGLTSPQLQLFQSDQIGAGGSTNAGEEWREGVRYNSVGRRLTYRIIKTPMPGNSSPETWDYQARDFLLLMDAKRINQGRGMPWLHHGANSCLSMIDLVELEKKVAYLNSYFGAIIKSKDGEMPPGFQEILEGGIETETTTKQDGTVETRDVMRRYADFMGGAAMPVLGPGEELQFVKSERPSLTFTGFIDWLVNDIAWGFGVPPAFVWAVLGRTGPETRMTLQQADWFFRHIMRLMVNRFCDPVRNWIIDYGLITGKINGGRLPNTGRSPYARRWRGPRKLTIDDRYFYKTWIDRLEAGMGTEEEFYGEQGKEWLHEQEQRVLEVKNLMRLCEDAGVPYHRVRANKPGSIPSTAEGEDAQGKLD